MARRLKDTLPKRFPRLVENRDVEALKDIFDDRSPDARDREGNTALHLTQVPEEIKTWLLDQGADINARNVDGDTPLHTHVAHPEADPRFLLERGADVDVENNRGENPTFVAVSSPEMMDLLIRAGADPHTHNEVGDTPLIAAIRTAEPSRIPALAQVVRLLDPHPSIQRDLEVTRDSVIDLGHRFESIRDAYDPATVEQVARELAFLYGVFDVAEEEQPTRPVRHDGTSPITLPGRTWQEQFIAAWDFLVPVTGRPRSLQGEAIRIAGVIADEFHGNDGVNWDDDHRRMARALLDITAQGTPLGEDEAAELAAAVKKVRKGKPSESDVDKLPRLATAWVAANPRPRPLGETTYER